MITNKYNMPDHMVRAITSWNSKYSKGDANYSVTGLIKSAHLANLEKKYRDWIEEDATDLFWRAWGSTAHALFADGHESALQEVRFFSKIGRAKISGQVDIITADGWMLDTKTTSIYSLSRGDIECQAVGTDRKYRISEDWVWQLNIYRYLSKFFYLALAWDRDGTEYEVDESAIPEIKRLGVSVALRDWSKSRAMASDDYPHAPAFDIEVPIKSLAEVREYIASRIAEHQNPPEDCTPKERWERPGHWTLPVNGKPWRRGKKYQDLEEAMKEKKELELSGKVVDLPEYHPGVAVRCESYCPVSAWCDAYQKRKGEKG